MTDDDGMTEYALILYLENIFGETNIEVDDVTFDETDGSRAIVHLKQPIAGKCIMMCLHNSSRLIIV